MSIVVIGGSTSLLNDILFDHIYKQLFSFQIY